MVISVSHLSKYYRVYQKDPGVIGSFKSLFNRKYEEVKAVDDISFDIQEGELIGFIGPNGAGKTTTLKCLSGLLYPTSGNVSVLGHVPFQRDYAFLRHIALIMGQKNQLMWDLPPIDTFHLNKAIYDIADKRFRTVLEDLTALLEVEDILKIQVKKLSLGQRMKCELIASLLHSPRVLFLDEPTIGLDVVMQKTLREFIKEYNRQYKATVILTSHYMRDVEALCKRVIIINHGKLLYDGLLSDLVKKHAPYKTVRIIIKDSFNPRDLEGAGKVKSFQYPELVLMVSSGNLSDVVSQVFKKIAIEDLTIEEPDIEDVIRDVFMKGEKDNK